MLDVDLLSWITVWNELLSCLGELELDDEASDESNFSLCSSLLKYSSCLEPFEMGVRAMDLGRALLRISPSMSISRLVSFPKINMKVRT